MPRTGENIYKRKDGRWEGRYIKGRSSSQTHYGYIYGKSYRDVKARLVEVKAKWQLHQSAPSIAKTDDTLSNIADAWIKNSESFLKESTLVKYKNLLRSYIIPELGNCNISEITNNMIFAFSSELLNSGGAKGTGLSPKTVSDVLSLLRSIQKFACNRNMNANFTTCCVQIKQKPKRLRVFSVQEQKILCSYLKSDMTLSNLGILLCLFTGMRVGELCALKWEDISLIEKTIYIHQTLQRLHADNNSSKTKILVSAPKSSCSIRIVPIPDVIMDEITLACQPPETYFLTGRKDKFIEPRTMQNRFKAVLKICRIEDANFHTLRHTFATRCVEVGFDIKSLSEILGHANVNITLNRYVHPTLELKRKNMSKLSELFSVE